LRTTKNFLTRSVLLAIVFVLQTNNGRSGGGLGGYASSTYPQGYSMVANLLNSGSNTVSEIFLNPPDYLTIFKPNPTGTGFNGSTFDPDAGGWTDPGLALNLGEGAFLFNPLPGNYTNTVVGWFPLRSTNVISTGYSICASAVPQSGGLQTILGFPVSNSDTQNTTIYRYVPATGGYKTYTYDVETLGGQWTSSASDGPEPSIGFGEAFWVYNPNGPKLWVRNIPLN
jgi:hypothetical protein